MQAFIVYFLLSIVPIFGIQVHRFQDGESYGEIETTIYSEIEEPSEIFAPKNFRIVDESNQKALNIYFHNSFEPFDTLSCHSVGQIEGLCNEHPRCAIVKKIDNYQNISETVDMPVLSNTEKERSECVLHPSYVQLVANNQDWCDSVLNGNAYRNDPVVGIAELKSVVFDLLSELQVEPSRFLASFEDSNDVLSLCNAAQEFAREVLGNERNNTKNSEERSPDNNVDEDLLSSGLGFIGNTPSNLVPQIKSRVSQAQSIKSHTANYNSSSNIASIFSRSNTEGNPIRVGINGFGRIGRLVFRAAMERPGIVVNHINCSMSPDYMAYMLKYDSAHGIFKGSVEARANSIVVNGHEISLSATRQPEEIAWSQNNVDFVCESTGVFTATKDALRHVEREGGARHVVISAPAKDDDTPTLVVGVNAESDYSSNMKVVSCASCTTNALAPLVKIIDSQFGLQEGLMTTVHAATGTQKVVDNTSNKDWRGGRSALTNIIPSSTGAAKAVAKCLPHMKGKLTGMAFRVPTLDVSVVDLTCRLNKSTSYEEIKAAVREASQTYMKGIMGYSEEALVSSDLMGNTCSSIFDANAGIMLNSNFVKLVSWYDNEMGYSNRILDLITLMAHKDGI